MASCQLHNFGQEVTQQTNEAASSNGALMLKNIFSVMMRMQEMAKSFYKSLFDTLLAGAGGITI